MIRLTVLCAVLAAPVQAEDFEFCWIGANGFAVEGRMTVPADALTKPLVTEADVTDFAIFGTVNSVPVGQWSLDDLTPETSWNLNFDPSAMMFATGGYSSTDNGQQWNADGNVNNCGASGFGFNSGGGGQDVCVKNTYRRDSIIAPDTPFPVYLRGTGPTCGTSLLGGLTHSPRSAS